MFATALPPIDHYRRIGTETAVSQASPHQLVILLFDGAIAAVLQARHALATGDTATKVSTLSKAMRIIDEGLKASLESHSAPALADNLRALFTTAAGLDLMSQGNVPLEVPRNMTPIPVRVVTPYPLCMVPSG